MDSSMEQEIAQQDLMANMTPENTDLTAKTIDRVEIAIAIDDMNLHAGHVIHENAY